MKMNQEKIELLIKEYGINLGEEKGRSINILRYDLIDKLQAFQRIFKDSPNPKTRTTTAIAYKQHYNNCLKAFELLIPELNIYKNKK